jgi:hypothetical protein
VSNPLCKPPFSTPVCQVSPAQIHITHADLYALLARKEELLIQVASLDKRIAFEFAKLLQP